MTISEIKQKYGDDFFDKVWKPSVPPVSQKPIINNFEEFDDEAKTIYRKIDSIIKAYNPANQLLRVYASGDRVKGTWRNDQEREDYTKAFLLPETIKPNYGVFTDAEFLPPKEIFNQALSGIEVSFNSSGNKILIS
jgi:hypothetical protein